MLRAFEFSEDALKRIDEAIQFEKTCRIESLLNLRTDILGFNLRPITLRDLLELEVSENALMTGGEPHVEDVAFLLFRLSEVKDTKSFIKRTVKRLRSDKDLYDEAVAFFQMSLNDIPASPKSDGKTKTESLKDSGVWLVPMIDNISSQYGWTVDYILDCNASTIFQLYQRILKRQLGEKYSVTNRVAQQARANEMNNSRSQ